MICLIYVIVSLVILIIGLLVGQHSGLAPEMCGHWTVAYAVLNIVSLGMLFGLRLDYSELESKLRVRDEQLQTVVEQRDEAQQTLRQQLADCHTAETALRAARGELAGAVEDAVLRLYGAEAEEDLPQEDQVYLERCRQTAIHNS